MKNGNFSRKKKTKNPEQLELQSLSHGGKRKGAGRKKSSDKIRHLRRERIKSKFPFHLTVRFKEGEMLRKKGPYRIFRAALARAKKFGLRSINFHLLGNHYHIEGEADSNRAVTNGMRSINGCLAKLLNTRVSDRYDIKIATTPTQVRNMLIYIFANSAKHFERTQVFDYYSSFCMFEHAEKLSRIRKDLDWRMPSITPQILMEFAEPLSAPKSWLARKGWMRATA